jgi:hypothetical protein
MQFSPWSVFLLFRSKYPQHSILNKFHTHIVQLVWDGKTKDSGLNDSMHSLNLICSWFHHECYSDLYHPQVFEFCHIFKWFVCYPYILVLSLLWMTGHDHILCLLCIYFQTNIPTSF